MAGCQGKVGLLLGMTNGIDVNGFGTFSNHYEAVKSDQRPFGQKQCSVSPGRPFRMLTDTNAAPRAPRLIGASQQFLEFARIELQFAAQSVAKYDDCLRQVCRMIGDHPVTEIGAVDITNVKAQMLARGNSVCRQIVILAAVKGLWRFAATDWVLRS